MKGLVPLLEAVAKLRTERDVELTVIGRPNEGGRVDRAIARLGLADAVHCVSGITDDELAHLYGEAQVAVVPSLYEGFSLPAIEAMSCGVAVVATTGGALPEVVGTDGETGLLVPPDDPGALAGAIARLLDDPDLRARLGAAGRERVVSRFTWQVTAAGTAACYEAVIAGSRFRARRWPRRRPGRDAGPRSSLMLTVDYDRLGVGPGDRVLDLGCGFGRHAFEAARRGASVVALDAGPDEVAQVRGTFAAMIEMGEIPPDHPATAVQGDALSLPFADGTFDRVIASEVLEHIPDDTAAMRELARVLRPGGAMAVTVPRCGPEAINWALSDEYHDTPGGHVRIYRRSTLERRLQLGRARADGTPPRPRTALALLVAALPRRPVQRLASGCRGVPQGAGVGHRQSTVRHADGRPGAEPGHRQEPGALPDQAGRQRGGPARRAPHTAPRCARAGAGRPHRARELRHDHRRDPFRHTAGGARHPDECGRARHRPRHCGGAAP